jgi:SAM-dependent methyltransferase
VSYGDQTRHDRNPLKRWVQRRRLRDAVALTQGRAAPKLIVDYGAGDGALAIALAQAHPAARIVCFEPAMAIRAEAEALTAAHPAITIVAEEADLPSGADIVTCTEVFEHLPPEAFQRALAEIIRVVAPAGIVIFGVPVETGPPALAKGLFRMARRYGEEDARLGRVLAATLYRPPPRTAQEIAPGRSYLHAHLGFDHRAFAREIARRMTIVQRRTSPLPWGSWAASELYLVATPR